MVYNGHSTRISVPPLLTYFELGLTEHLIDNGHPAEALKCLLILVDR